MGQSVKDLYIIGAGGFGREVAWLVERMNQQQLVWKLCGFIDDDVDVYGSVIDGYTVLGGCSILAELDADFWVVCAVGDARVRQKVIEKVRGYEYLRFATLIDPDAKVSSRVDIGEGTVICAGNIITVDIHIGAHCIINLDCTVGHDVKLEDFVTLYPGVHVSGCVDVGKCTELGTGAQIIQKKNIGAYTIIGAGSVVITDIPSYCTAVGSPAKVIKGNSIA